MKKLLTVLLTLLIVFSVASCTQKAQADEFNVGTLKGPSGMGMIKVISDNAEDPMIGDATVNFTISGAPDEIIAKLLSGDLDAAAVPMNMGAILYNKTEGNFVIASANTLGVIYIVENGNTITDINDLMGKTIYMGGQGSTADIAFRYILTLYDMDPETDVHIVYTTEHAEAAAKAISEEGSIVLLPEPFVTSVLLQNANARVALDLNALYEEGSDGTLMMTAFVVNKEFAEAYPGTVNAFLEEYEASVDYVNENIDEAAALIEEFGILPSAAVAAKAIPNCNIVYLDASDTKADITDILTVFYNFNPSTVGGSVPGEDIFYEK